MASARAAARLDNPGPPPNHPPLAMAGPPAAKPPRPPEADPDVELARSMKAGAAPWMRAGVLHILLAAALIGGPWWRGRARVEQSAGAFARFAACVFDGAPTAPGGLALPEGDRLAFARQVRLAGADWPSRCEPSLDGIATEEAILLMPSVREREATVRVAVTVVREALRRVERGPASAVGITPLDAIGRLQAALTELVGAAGVAIDPEAPAIRLAAPPPEPASRIPLTVAEGGRTEVRWAPEGLDLVASDARRVAVVRVRGGTVLEEHERRAGAARGLVVGPRAASHLLFTTPAEACASDEDRCVHRMTGLTATDGTAPSEREAQVWLGGHLIGRPDRSAWVDGARIGLLVTGQDGLAAALFELPAPPEAAAEGDPDAGDTDDEAGEVPRVPARARLALGRARDALLTRERVLWLDGSLRAAAITPDGFGPTLRAEAVGDRLWACGDFVVLGRAEGIEVRRASTLALLGAAATPLRPPLAAGAPEEEPVQLACSGDNLLVALIRRRGLDLLRCDAAGCVPLESRSQEVLGASVAIAAGEAWIASWGGAGADQVVVRRGGLDATALSDAGLLPPCWSDGRGLCGPAILAGEGDRLALVVRENADALVLGLDGGRLGGLPGFAPAAPPAAIPAPPGPMAAPRRLPYTPDSPGSGRTPKGLGTSE
jgi:hypothetical protein